MTEERRDHEDMPEHERRPDTGVGGGLTSQGGTARESGMDRAHDPADPNEAIRQPVSDLAEDDEEPEDPDGPEAAYQPRSI